MLATPHGAMGDGQGSILVNFQPSAAGEYLGRLVMRLPLVTRIYDFYFTVQAPHKGKPLEFEAPARQAIT